MMLRLAILPVLLAVANTPAAAPPSTKPNAVEVWLDRAAADIRAAADNPGGKPSMPSALDLAIMLVQARGNELDRGLLRELLDRPRPPLPPKADPAAADFSWKINAAIAYAVLGEMESARAMVREAEKSAKAVRGFLGTIVPASLATAWAAIGDVAAAKAVQLQDPPVGDRLTAFVWLARHLNDFGRVAARDQMLLEATKLAMEREDETRRAIGLREVAKEMIEQGRLPGARAVVEQMPVAYPRSDAYLALARAYDAEADAEAASNALRAAIETLHAMEEEGGRFYAAVADAAAELDHPGAITRAVAAAEQYLREAHPDERASTLPRLARCLAAVGDADGVRRLLAEARRAITAVDDPERRGDATLGLAAAFARMGDKQRAAQEIARAKAIHREDDYSVSDQFSDVLTAFIRAGESAHAIQLARQHGFEPPDLDWLHEEAVRTHLRGRRFDHARRHAMEVNNQRRRVRALRVIALAQARLGHEEELVEWVSALPAAYDRAVLYLGLAQQALNLDGRGLTRLLRF